MLYWLSLISHCYIEIATDHLQCHSVRITIVIMNLMSAVYKFRIVSHKSDRIQGLTVVSPNSQASAINNGNIISWTWLNCVSSAIHNKICNKLYLLLSKPESVKIYQLMNQCPALTSLRNQWTRHVNITFEFANSKLSSTLYWFTVP